MASATRAAMRAIHGQVVHTRRALCVGQIRFCSGFGNDVPINVRGLAQSRTVVFSSNRGRDINNYSSGMDVSNLNQGLPDDHSLTRGSEAASFAGHHDATTRPMVGESFQGNLPEPYEVENEGLLRGLADGDLSSGPRMMMVNRVSPRWDISGMKRTFAFSANDLFHSGIRCFSTTNCRTASGSSKKEQLQQAVKDYGSTVIVFHVSISLMSLGFFYILVSSGIDVVGLVSQVPYIGQHVSRSSVAAGASTFVVAYAVHKVFAPVRISVTLGATPFIVKYLRSKGVLKPRKH